MVKVTNNGPDSSLTEKFESPEKTLGFVDKVIIIASTLLWRNLNCDPFFPFSLRLHLLRENKMQQCSKALWWTGLKSLFGNILGLPVTRPPPYNQIWSWFAAMVPATLTSLPCCLCCQTWAACSAPRAWLAMTPSPSFSPTSQGRLSTRRGTFSTCTERSEVSQRYSGWRRWRRIFNFLWLQILTPRLKARRCHSTKDKSSAHPKLSR